MYHASTDTTHVAEETQLAMMMDRTHAGRKDMFSLDQWKQSKKEFWDIVQRTIDVPPKSIINLGCGFDTSGIALERQGYTFVHFDIVPDMLLRLQREHGATFCVTGDILHVPFKKESFDYVISIDVIHHEANDLQPILTTCFDLLKPGGTLYLEDPNAWGMFQFVKSILLPRSLYRSLRELYHTLKRSSHRPATYEFPTNVWRVARLLKEIGFTDVVIQPNQDAYPSIGPMNYRIYALFKWSRWIRTYHNYHYIICAKKENAQSNCASTQ
jgi:SAM-dependent methyltransferase